MCYDTKKNYTLAAALCDLPLGASVSDALLQEWFASPLFATLPRALLTLAGMDSSLVPASQSGRTGFSKSGLSSQFSRN
jgi:hypothetical protein